MEGRYLDPESVEQYRHEVELRRKKQQEEKRDAVFHKSVCWAGLLALGGGLTLMILNGLIDQTIGTVCLAVACAVLGRGTK